MEHVCIGIINYNGMKSLPVTLQAVQKLDYPSFEVVIVDNGSTDGSLEWILKNYPEYACVCLPENLGPAGARQLILKKAESNLVLLLDNDVAPEPDSLSKLVEIINKVPNAALCHMEIKDYHNPKTWFYYNGGYIHYICALIPRKYKETNRPEYENYDTFSGQAILVKRDISLIVGGFDESFFFGWEDGDFVVRLSLAGYGCLNVPSAIALHKAQSRELSKAYYQIRNRWFFILKIYSWKTLVLALPAFLMFEISQFFLVTYKGSVKEYIKAVRDIFTNLDDIMEKRKNFQKVKIKQDKEWLKSGEIFVPSLFLQNRILGAAKIMYNDLLNKYWDLIRRYC